jgi:hypothetical protein
VVGHFFQPPGCHGASSQDALEKRAYVGGTLGASERDDQHGVEGACDGHATRPFSIPRWPPPPRRGRVYS